MILSVVLKGLFIVSFLCLTSFAMDSISGVPIHFAVAGEKAAIPCNISTPLSDDQVSLILWYRVDMPNPIYTLDIRKRTIKEAKHFPSPEIKDRSYFNMNIHPPTLYLEPARVEDEADYKCRVDLRRSRTLILHTRLNIIVPPGDPYIMDEHGQRLRDIIGPYDEGAFLTLACEVDGGDPSPEVTWWRGTTLLDDSFNVTPQGFVRNELFLFELRRSDLLAEYTCQATNTNLTRPRTSAVRIDINLRPLEVKIAAPHYPLNAGNRKQIICETTGSRPRAALSWWLDGKKIGAGTTDTVSDGGNLTVSTLHFVPTPDDNNKILSCRAENSALPNSAIEDEWVVRVHYAPIINLAFGASISLSNIKEGSDVYLECNIRANPWVNDVTWQFEDHYVQSNKSAGVIISNQTLVLQSVRREHRGRYRCLAGNSEGQSVSDYLHLLVQYAPVCKLSDPKVYGVARTEVVNVTCEVEADPPDVNFRWALNNTLEVVNLQKWWSEGSRSVLSYTPKTLAGYGLLLCWGSNGIGGQREPCVAKIIPAGAPESPRECSVTNQSSQSLSVECEPGYDGGLTQTFHLELYNSVVEHLAANLTMMDTPAFKVSGLPSGTAFVLVLYASNGKGKSNSVALMASTLPPPERRTEEEMTAVNPILGILIGAVAVLVLIAVIVIIIVRVQTSKGSSKETPSQEESNRCETPLKKELEDSQDTSEKGPDIIPFANDTEVYFTGGSTEQLRHIRSIQKLSASPTEFRERPLDTRL
ncbi:synaptogenesis protein syg-2 isoform X2 [Parasteatoda tepidariorum]|uniref:synaptogenesis protein syg-2 isoform X2 n=1 Tax=Parasteatoda tepidariorum TaxID=114398 RepID=UPI001C71D192|nr:nephrin isoform X2 [Parasteatoda tepidariorum]